MIPVECATGHRLGDAETLHDAAALVALHANTEHGRRVSADAVAEALYLADPYPDDEEVAS